MGLSDLIEEALQTMMGWGAPMGMTDDLRSYVEASGRMDPEVREELLQLVDDIDDELAYGWMELPRDADGTAIRMDDTVRFRDALWTVIAITHTGKLQLRAPGRKNQWTFPEHVRFDVADSWEAIENELHERIARGEQDAEWMLCIVERCRRLAGGAA